MKDVFRATGREKALRAVDELTDELVGTLRDMVCIPTVNPPGECYEEFCRYYDDLLAELGYETETVRVPPDRLAELAPLGDGGNGPAYSAALKAQQARGGGSTPTGITTSSASAMVGSVIPSAARSRTGVFTGGARRTRAALSRR